MHFQKVLLTSCAVALLTLLIPSVSFAACLLSQCASCMSAPCGWYVEANGGSTHITEEKFPGKSSSSGLGGNANLGYKFMPFFAMEIGYSRYKNTNISEPVTNVGIAKIKHSSYDIAFKGIVPLAASGFEIFAKIGGARVLASTSLRADGFGNNLGVTKSDHSVNGLYAGAGAQYYFMPEIALVVQWQRAKGNHATGTLDLLSAGLSVLFN